MFHDDFILLIEVVLMAFKQRAIKRFWKMTVEFKINHAHYPVSSIHYRRPRYSPYHQQFHYMAYDA